MKRAVFDDFGSYPLPAERRKEWIKAAFANPVPYKDELYEIIKEAMWQKINAGVEVPNYPQFQNMITQFSEPSMGLDPRIEEGGIITALELASEYAFRSGIDTQIHLHSPIFYETVCQVEGIKGIGMESAANPSLLSLIDKDQLDKYDKFLRIGVSRTDIFSMAAEYDEIHHTNAFRDKGVLDTIVNEYNSPDKVKKRLEKAYSIFGDQIKYVGPDCGLGSFPNQELAYLVLKNTAAGIKAFYSGEKKSIICMRQITDNF